MMSAMARVVISGVLLGGLIGFAPAGLEAWDQVTETAASASAQAELSIEALKAQQSDPVLSAEISPQSAEFARAVMDARDGLLSIPRDAVDMLPVAGK